MNPLDSQNTPLSPQFAIDNRISLRYSSSRVNARYYPGAPISRLAFFVCPISWGYGSRCTSRCAAILRRIDSTLTQLRQNKPL